MDALQSSAQLVSASLDDDRDTVVEPPPWLAAPTADASPHGAGEPPAAAVAAGRPSRMARGSSTRETRDLPTIGHVGRYALKYLLGDGGLGSVHAAHDPLLSRLVAIKTLKVDAPRRAAFDAAFLNEARASAGLSHPHIVTVFDAGLSDQGPYIAMELLKGRDLGQLRSEGWRATPAQAATIIRRVAEALAYAHAKGVVHRDIKPANILMVGRTQPRVLDFGIASIAGRDAPLADGEEDEVLASGTPYYMAPEQLRGEAVDRRVDVFALGVVFYELLCGAKPFRGRTLAEIRHAVLNTEPPPPHTLDRRVPSALSAIVARAIAKQPESRYHSARRMARDLRQWLEEHAQEELADAAAAPPAERPRRRALTWCSAAALVVALGAAAWWLGRLSVDPSAALPRLFGQGAATIATTHAAALADAPAVPVSSFALGMPAGAFPPSPAAAPLPVQ